MRAIARLIPFLLLVLAQPTVAAEFHEDEYLSLTLPISDDLYAAGERVDITNTVEGDVFVGGGNIIIKGDIRNDIAAVGGNLRIEGDVGDDVRVAGGSVIISGLINDDLFIAGGDIAIEPTAVIEGDVVIAGGNVQMRGTVRGKLRMYGGDLLLAGPVEGTVDIRGETVTVGSAIGGETTVAAERIILGSSARFNGNLHYWQSGGPLTFAEGTLGGEATFDETLGHPAIDEDAAAVGFAALVGAFSLFSFLSGALLIGLLMLLTRTYFPDAARILRSEVGASTLWGLLFFLLTPVVAVLAMITIIGFPIGLFLLTYYFFVLLLFAKPVTALVLAHAAAQHWQWKPGKLTIFAASLGFLLLLLIMSWIPVLGWIVKAVIIILTIGALQITKYRKIKKIL